MLRLVLCDDERLALQRLRQLLAPHPGFQIVGEAGSKAAALKLIRKERPDALFLDVQMPGASGFDLIKSLPHPPKLIMITAYAKYAVQAFDVEAVDYLVKPVTPQRFAQALQRLKAACTKRSAPKETLTRIEDQICLHTPQQTLVVPVRSIPLLQADGDFTRIHVPNSAPLMICHPLGSYEKTLPFPPFARIDRSHIINLNHITRVERKSRDEANLVLDGVKDKIPMGRAAQLRLKDHLPKG
jgi:two-component system LytT family response regulator